jgi:hypothetical protein
LQSRLGDYRAANCIEIGATEDAAIAPLRES